ncbi:MAG: glycosyltransferase family 39 protein [Lentisphaerae bacterium]|nr:glycosyltransferase family 39 protein [Lentisphaerota bacterium]
MWKNKLLKISDHAGKAIGKVEKYCGDPARTVTFFALVLTVFYTVQCSLFQNILGLDVLETITWGAQGAWGHAKHPPLSGWLGYGISYLGGHKDWIMYLAAHCCTALSVIYVYKCARIFMDKYESGTAALLLYFLFYYSPSETKFCTYPLEMMLVPMSSFYFFRALQDNKWHNWLLLGLLAALGILNKYSFGLVMTAWAVIFFRNKANLQLLKSAKPYLAAALMIVLLLPHLRWLYENDFVCLTHVGNRLSDEYKWYTPLVTISTAAYPYGMMALVLLLTSILNSRTLQRTTIKKAPAIDFLLIAALPAVTLIVLSFFGDIIQMWFCTMAAMAAAAITAFFPWKIDRRFFAGTVLLLTMYSILMMLGTTLDVTLKSKPRVHSLPESYTFAAVEFYRKHDPTKPIPIVVGPRFEATVLENYLPHRPPACEIDDPIFLKLYTQKIRREGALLIGKPEKFEQFKKDMNIEQINFQKINFTYKSLWGKKRKRAYFLAYLPPVSSEAASVPSTVQGK